MTTMLSRGAGRVRTRVPARRPLRSGLVLALAGAQLGESLVLRRRARRLIVLPSRPSPDPLDEQDHEVDVVGITARGIELSASTLAAARTHLTQAGLAAVDLVPSDMSADHAIAFLRRVDPGRIGKTSGTAPGGAHRALVVTEELALRLGLGDEHDRRDLDPSAMVRVTRTVQRAASDRLGLAVAPGLSDLASQDDERDRGWAELEAIMEVGQPYASLASALVVLESMHVAALVTGVLLRPGAGAAALLSFSAKPALVFGRNGVWAPPQLGRSGVIRLPERARQLLGLGRAGLKTTRDAARVRARAEPRPVPDVSTLFEPRRTDCPWCASSDLCLRAEMPDLFQHKPGRFRLDECSSCGHVFQNPQLSPAGLSYYYDEFYDGIGGELMERLFAGADEDNELRVAAVAAVQTPDDPKVERWLDVGTGHGHFCLTARRHWPEVSFEGLDLSDSVEEAERRGWIERAHRGLFPDLAGSLRKGYDVISMHHYLEHTRDPRAELDAAAKVLAPGGLLTIEVPDAQCAMSRRLGQYWLPYLQPQHLNFVTAPNLTVALQEREFDVVTLQRDQHQCMELFGGLALMLENILPTGQNPWRPPSSRGRQLARGLMMFVASPLLAAAWSADQVLGKVVPRFGPANAYRIIARKR